MSKGRARETLLVNKQTSFGLVNLQKAKGFNIVFLIRDRFMRLLVAFVQKYGWCAAQGSQKAVLVDRRELRHLQCPV